MNQHPQRLRRASPRIVKHWTCFDCALVILYVVAKPLSAYEWIVPRSHMCPHCLYLHVIKLRYITGVWAPLVEVLPEKYKTPRYKASK